MAGGWSLLTEQRHRARGMEEVTNLAREWSVKYFDTCLCTIRTQYLLIQIVNSQPTLETVYHNGQTITSLVIPFLN